MKPLTLEETALKEEMKERCLAKGQYIDENAKAKFKMLCHLEDFEVQYWELEQRYKKQKEVIDKITSNIKNDIDGFMTINDHGECNDILDLLNIYLDILNEVTNNE